MLEILTFMVGGFTFFVIYRARPVIDPHSEVPPSVEDRFVHAGVPALLALMIFYMAGLFFGI